MCMAYNGVLTHPSKVTPKISTPSISPKNFYPPLPPSHQTFYSLLQLETKNRKMWSKCTNLSSNITPDKLKKQSEIWRNIVNLMQTLTSRLYKWMVQMWERCKPLQFIGPKHWSCNVHSKSMFAWNFQFLTSLHPCLFQFDLDLPNLNSELLSIRPLRCVQTG